MEMSNKECDLSCDPANPRRSPVPGLESGKYATEDCAVAGNQASVPENATGNKKLVQQAFHPSLFTTRTRSASTGSRSDLDEFSMHKLKQQVKENQCLNAYPPEWQRIPTSRNPKRKKLADSPPPITTSNKYGNLPVDTAEREDVTVPNKLVKPPPIILYGIDDVNKLTELLNTVVDGGNFSYKIINRNQLRISSTSIENYKKLIGVVRERGLIGHTFNRKDERNYRIVIRNLHPTTPHSAIKEEIELTGNVVVGEIINSKYGPEKKPTSTFFVNLLAGPNNKAVKDIKYIFHQAVIIEDPRKRKFIAQCQRCQQYGHTKNYCMRPYRCVKCAQKHKTSECPKRDRNTPAECALCHGPHPANYKGCEVYKEISSRKIRIYKESELRQETILTVPPITQSEVYVTSGESYAEKVKSNAKKRVNASANLQTHSVSDTIEKMLLKQSEKFDLLLQQMSTMLGLITTLIKKLSN